MVGGERERRDCGRAVQCLCCVKRLIRTHSHISANPPRAYALELRRTRPFARFSTVFLHRTLSRCGVWCMLPRHSPSSFNLSLSLSVCLHSLLLRTPPPSAASLLPRPSSPFLVSSLVFFPRLLPPSFCSVSTSTSTAEGLRGAPRGLSSFLKPTVQPHRQD